MIFDEPGPNEIKGEPPVSIGDLGEKLINESQEYRITDIILRHLNVVAEKMADPVEEA
ncbi:MAG: hypothetical protein NT099_01605 [Candidatus Saganbacteria bacterium]|nr:hypothetical protein [Candidatus Saganbacteria bacterium]